MNRKGKLLTDRLRGLRGGPHIPPDLSGGTRFKFQLMSMNNKMESLIRYMKVLQ